MRNDDWKDNTYVLKDIGLAVLYNDFLFGSPISTY